MANFSQTHPAMAAKLADLIESGLNPEQIIDHFRSTDEAKAISDKEWDDIEVFPDAIHIISQALAYRAANIEDAEELQKLLESAYKPETVGSEAFRSGEVIARSALNGILLDSSYKWLLVEAPSGKGIEQDGVILGAACFSTDGVVRNQGILEGNLGSIRFLAVLPRYHGFCVGRRLLERAEDAMFAAGCCKVMACIPTTRTTAMDWLERRGYVEAGCIPYPAGLGHSILPDCAGVELVRFIKCKPEPEAEGSADTGKPSGTWHLKNKPTLSANPPNKAPIEEVDEDEILGVD